MQVLAGDIGGTKTLLTLAEVRAEGGSVHVTLAHARRYDSGRFGGLAELCRQYARDEGLTLPQRAGFGVAGPVVGGTSKITNLPWLLDERALAQSWGSRASGWPTTSWPWPAGCPRCSRPTSPCCARAAQTPRATSP